MDGPRGRYVKSNRERQILYDLTYMWNLKQKQKNQLIQKEIKFAVTRGGNRELDEGGQKVQTSSLQDK